MANRWLFAGLDLSQVRVQAGTPAASTTAGTFNTTYADYSVSFSSANRGIIDFVDSSGGSDSATTGEKLNFHCDLFLDDHSTVGNHLEILNGSDQPWLAIRQTASGVYGLHYNSGTGASPTWTLVGSTTSLSNGRYTIDVWITIGSPHDAGWAVNSSQVATGTFTQASLTSLDAALFRSSTTTNGSFASEVMATVGINLVNGHVFYGKATGAGSNSGFSGTYADIDDQGINDSDSIGSTVAGQISTFVFNNLPTLATNEALGDLFMIARAKNDGSSPLNVKPVRRTSGGSDQVGSSFSGISIAYQPFLTRFTGISEAEYNGSEFGVESAA